MNGFCYFLTSVGGNYFGKCKQTTSIGCEWSSGTQTSLTSFYFLFRSRFYFRFYLSFRHNTYCRPSRARDLVTTAEVGSGRVPSLGRVTTGIESALRGAKYSLGTSSRPFWLGLSVSITFLSNTREFTLKIPKYSGADSLLRQMQSLPQCKAECALPTTLWWR